MKMRHIILWLPPVLYYAFITFLSSVSGFTWGTVAITPFPGFDKIVHMVLYGFLGMALARALMWEQIYHHIKKSWYLYFFMIIPFVGLLDEIHQLFVAGRSTDFMDLSADLFGATCGGLLYRRILGDPVKSGDFFKLRAKDAGGVGLLLAMTYFVSLVFANLFDYKQGLLKEYSHFYFLILLLEYSLLGFFTIRFFYLKNDKRFFKKLDWLLLLLAGSTFIAMFQTSLFLFKKPFQTVLEVAIMLTSFYGGGLFYYFDKQIEKFRNQIFEDPLYHKRIWQRIYFYLPPLVIAVAIIFNSSFSPRALYNMHIPSPEYIVPATGPFSIFRNYNFLHMFEFFWFGLFYFRAVLWESWWHKKSRSQMVWGVGYTIFIVICIFDEVIQYYVPGRVGDIKDVFNNLIGGNIALATYMYVYQSFKEAYHKIRRASLKSDAELFAQGIKN